MKLVGITHAQRGAREAILDAAFPRGPDDRHIHLMTLANSFARSAATTVLQGGGTLVIPPRLGDIDALRRFVRASGITVAALSPPYVRDILRGAPGEPAFLGVRLLLGTAALTRAERRQVLERVAPLAHIGYSTNEAGYLALAGPTDLAIPTSTASAARCPASKPRSSTTCSNPLPRGTPGELRFRHRDFPAGYVDPVPGSTSRFRDGWFYPGDAGVIWQTAASR